MSRTRKLSGLSIMTKINKDILLKLYMHGYVIDKITFITTYFSVPIFGSLYEFLILDIGIMVRVFANGLGYLGSISRSSHTKDSKNGT